MKREWERAGDHQLESVITLGLSTLNIHVAIKVFFFFFLCHASSNRTKRNHTNLRPSVNSVADEIAMCRFPGHWVFQGTRQRTNEIKGEQEQVAQSSTLPQ